MYYRFITDVWKICITSLLQVPEKKKKKKKTYGSAF